MMNNLKKIAKIPQFWKSIYVIIMALICLVLGFFSKQIKFYIIAFLFFALLICLILEIRHILKDSSIIEDELEVSMDNIKEASKIIIEKSNKKDAIKYIRKYTKLNKEDSENLYSMIIKIKQE